MLALLIAATSILLVSLSILLGTTWLPLLIPPAAFLFVVHVYMAMAHAAVGTLSLILLFLFPEDQATVLGFFIALGLGTWREHWRERVAAWRKYRPVYALIPVLLVPAVLLEAWVLHFFASGRVLWEGTAAPH